MKKVVVLSLLVIVSILFTSQIKRGFVSLAILVDSAGFSRHSIMDTFFGAPSLKSVKIPGRQQPLSADLYLPAAGGRHFPLLLVHGPDPEGKNAAHIARAAHNFARAGFLVLVPDLQGMKNLRLELADAEDILASYLYLKKHENAGSGGGMMGVSYGAGPMLLTAADARIRDSITFVATFGGYYDLRNVFLFGMTGAYEYGGHRGFSRPQESVRWMLAYRNLHILDSRGDREKFKQIIEQRNRYELAKGTALARTLDPEARRLYDFLINSDQDTFPMLYEGLPLALRERAYQLSPARAVKYIKASFFIAHATDDYAVPYTESIRLAHAVGERKPVHLALLPKFLHGEQEDSSIGSFYSRYLLGGWRLFGLIYDLLEQSEK